jgi:signal transduction histidine kinase
MNPLNPDDCTVDASRMDGPPLALCRTDTVEASATYISALGLIAHEMRSPGSIVSGYLRLLQQDSDGLSARQRKMVDDAGRACGRMLALLQEIGELASLERMTPVPAPMGVQVFDLCDEALKNMSVEGESGPAPRFMCPERDRSATVNGNAAWLKRAFGALMAATAREHLAEALECHGFVVDANESQQAVIAFGPRDLSFKPEDLMARRDEFDRWRGGTGLSLPIACRIIEAHGGIVWSPAGTQSRTSVWTLPIANALGPRS